MAAVYMVIITDDKGMALLWHKVGWYERWGLKQVNNHNFT